MDILKSIITLYKRELADVNELKLLYQAQLEQEQQQKEIEDLKQQLKALREEGEK